MKKRLVYIALAVLVLLGGINLLTRGAYISGKVRSYVVEKAREATGYDVGMGVVWYFGHHAVSHSLNGACGLPYMNVANNTSFLVDQRATTGTDINIPGVVTIPGGTGL